MGKATAIVGIDTDALSFAHPAAELSEEEDKKVSLKVRHYLKSASAKGTSILLPSVTIAEYLCQYQPSEHDRVIADLEDDFLFGDFNHLAIKELALIRIEKDAAKSVRKQTGQSKDEIKLDQMIAAISLAAGATHILTGNRKDFAGLTGGRLKIIDIRTLPMPVIPGDLFKDLPP